MLEKLKQLNEKFAEVAAISEAAAALAWDMRTYMPAGAAESRSEQLAVLTEIAQRKATAPENGALLDALEAEAAGLDPDSDDARMIANSRRDYDQATKVPPEFVAEQARAVAMAQDAWVRARQESNFSIFQPHMETLMELSRRFVGFFPPADHPYDTLLDQFEPGMKTADVKQIFDVLRPQQVELIHAIAARPQVDDSFLHQAFPEQAQLDFSVKVATAFGYDWNCGRQDKTAHPFTISLGQGDVRITTRVYPDFLNPCLFGTMHESGHAMYEQGVNPAYKRTALANGASLGIHESQSRMWENLVGRSLPFWTHFYPELQQAFPAQLGNVPLKTFYKGINKVAPSLIRVEADEATYNLHIMLRLEIEIALLEGKIAVKDLPEYWNAKMQEYLGVTTPNDAQGVLQDIHWSQGSLGYFSTYALGNLISAQLWEKINQAIPDLPEQIARGEFAGLLGWLRSNVHVYGRKYKPQELVQRITGEKINPAAYMRYLKRKYSEIYGL